LAVKNASEMTYTVSSGALNSTQTKLWTAQDLEVGNTNSICVKLNILCYTLLWRHVYLSYFVFA